VRTPEILERRLGARTPNAIREADEIATFDQLPLCLLSLFLCQ
jgi:hypothetical protein